MSQKKINKNAKKVEENITINEFLGKINDQVWSELVVSGKIYDIPVAELLKNKTEQQLNDLFYEVESVSMETYAGKDASFLAKMEQWLYDYAAYKRLNARENKTINTPSKQQLLALHYLLKFFNKDFNDIHADKTVQSKLLSLIFGKSIDNIRHDLSQYTAKDYKADFFKKAYLLPILEIFERIGNQDIIIEITSTINNLKDKSQ